MRDERGLLESNQLTEGFETGEFKGFYLRCEGKEAIGTFMHSDFSGTWADDFESNDEFIQEMEDRFPAPGLILKGVADLKDTPEVVFDRDTLVKLAWRRKEHGYDVFLDMFDDIDVDSRYFVVAVHYFDEVIKIMTYLDPEHMIEGDIIAGWVGDNLSISTWIAVVESGEFVFKWIDDHDNRYDLESYIFS